jgi:hypothetical protein
MLKLLRLPWVSKPVSCLIILSFLILTNSCLYFKVNRSSEPPAIAINKMQDENKFIILHLDDKAWKFTDIIIENEIITGKISELPSTLNYKKINLNGPTRYRKNFKTDESAILNEVHIYSIEFTKTDATKISIPLKSITKIEVYDKDTGATIASWGFSTLGIGLGVFGVLLIIVLLTKSSCPFIYAFNGTDYIFTGEIFSGATQPGLERDDYLLLPSIGNTDAGYKVKITNEVHEIQSVNLAELMVIDHPENVQVLIDKYGIPYLFSEPLSPFEARSTGNVNILSLIKSRDTLAFTGNKNNIGNNGIEDIILKFIKPANSESARLVIRAKNSFWLDVLITKLHKLFGENYNSYSIKEAGTPGEKLRKWQLEQNIPLSVYLEKNGKWEFTDYFNIAGPMAWRDDILNLNLRGISSDTVKIKLVTGFLFWEMDYAAMDFGTSVPVKPIIVQAKTAVTNNNEEISGLLLSSDKSYYVQNNTGDEAFLSFDFPQIGKGDRSVFLHTRGYYKILRDLTGKADKKKLRTFRKPNRLPAFSKETIDLLPAK